MNRKIADAVFNQNGPNRREKCRSASISFAIMNIIMDTAYLNTFCVITYSTELEYMNAENKLKRNIKHLIAHEKHLIDEK